MTFRIEHNVQTGEIIEIPLTVNEIKEQQERAAEIAIEVSTRQAIQAEAKEQRQILLNKLGITEEEAKLLLGGNY